MDREAVVELADGWSSCCQVQITDLKRQLSEFSCYGQLIMIMILIWTRCAEKYLLKSKKEHWWLWTSRRPRIVSLLDELYHRPWILSVVVLYLSLPFLYERCCFDILPKFWAVGWPSVVWLGRVRQSTRSYCNPSSPREEAAQPQVWRCGRHPHAIHFSPGVQNKS